MTPHDDRDYPQVLRGELAEGGAGRGLIITDLILGGVGSGDAAYMLMDLGETWIAWGVALFIVEPISLACLLALVALVAPDSLLAQFFRGALRRASVVMALLLFAFVVGTIGAFVWALWGYVTA